MCCVVSSSLCSKPPARPLHLFQPEEAMRRCKPECTAFSLATSVDSKCGAVWVEGNKHTASERGDKVQSVIQLPSALVTLTLVTV